MLSHATPRRLPLLAIAALALVASACTLEPVGGRVTTETAADITLPTVTPTPTPGADGTDDAGQGGGGGAAPDEGETENGEGDGTVAANSKWEVTGTPGELNVRGEPNTDAPPIGQINEGDIVTATGEVDDTWIAISAPIDGWVFSTFLSPSTDAGPEPEDEENAVEAGSEWTVTGTPGSLNVRSSPSTGQAPIGSVGEGATVVATGNASGSWIEIESPAGWVYTAYLRPGG